METLIATGAIGVIVGLLIKVLYDFIQPAKKNGTYGIPTECKMKLDRIIEQHADQYDYMDSQREDRIEASIHLKNINITLKENQALLREMIALRREDLERR